MINLIGAYGHSGPALLEGLDAVLALDETYIHWYGKAENPPPAAKWDTSPCLPTTNRRSKPKSNKSARRCG